MADGRLKRVKLAFERDFTQMPNEWIRDNKLSLGARGLLSLLMSHRDGYVVTFKSLAATNPEGLAALQRIVQELKEQKYLVIHKERYANGRIGGFVWELTDPAQEKSRSQPYIDFPYMDNPDMGNPYMDNPLLKEAQPKEHLTPSLNETGSSTGARKAEADASGDAPVAPAETPEQRYSRLIHEKCNRRPGHPHDWAASGYCNWCGNPRPSAVAELMTSA